MNPLEELLKDFTPEQIQEMVKTFNKPDATEVVKTIGKKKRGRKKKAAVTKTKVKRKKKEKLDVRPIKEDIGQAIKEGEESKSFGRRASLNVGGKNQFEDVDAEREKTTIIITESGKKKKISENAYLPRIPPKQRPKSQMYKVRCRCGREEIVDETQLAIIKAASRDGGTYKCNACITGSGGGSVFAEPI